MQLSRVGSSIFVQATGTSPLALNHVMGIGLNYAAHAKEQGSPIPERPVVFAKNTAALALDSEAIRVPKVCQDKPQVDFEGELAVIIGTAAREVSADKALSYVLGYAVANDVSARWWQKQGSGGQFYRGKSFDTFCPIGPRVTPASSVPDPNNLRLVTKVNGQVMQDSNTSDMIFSVANLIADLSRGMTLLPGTVILTGTPQGVGMARNPQVFLKDGDTVEIEIEKLGVLRNTVRFE